jgi:hypothetical protein
MTTFNFYIAKQYDIEDWPDFDSAKNQFIEDIANSNFDIENDDEGKAARCLSSTQRLKTDAFDMKPHLYYVRINNPQFYDFICDTVGSRAVADSEGQLITSCGAFRDELTDCIEQEGTEAGEFKPEEMIFLNHLKEIDNALKIENFDGDIWFYFDRIDR